MRVLVLTQYFWPENFRINEIANSLQRAGCNVSVLTGPPNYPDGDVFQGYSALSIRIEHKDGIAIHRVPLVPRGKGSAIRLILNYLSFVVSASIFGPYMLRGKCFDVVLVYAPGPILQAIPAVWLGFLKRAPVITWIQDLWPESLEVTRFVRSKHILNLVTHIVRWIYRRNHLLLVQSRSFVEPVRSMAGSTPVIYHPNPGELAFNPQVQGEPALQLNPGFNVVFAGNLGTVQALETILDAADRTRQYRDVWWVLIGSGSRSAWLLKEIQRRGLMQVILPGRFASEAMPLILAQASVLLVSLVRSPIMSQTVPSKVQAYLAAGRPIIAALDGEGARLVTEAGAGVACPAEDAEALSDAVLRLKALPPAELSRLGESGRNYYRQHFDPDVLTKRMIDCFRDLTIERSPGARTN